jgi:hypothetical protein
LGSRGLFAQKPLGHALEAQKEKLCENLPGACGAEPHFIFFAKIPDYMR